MIRDMHIMFRELAQRAGMQQVYDIRPEQIDIFLNIAIRTTIATRISASVQDVDSRGISSLIKTGQNNDFRTLFTVKEINFITSTVFKIDADEYCMGKLMNDGDDWPIDDAFIYYDYHVNYCSASGGWTLAGGKPSKTGDWISPKKRVRLIEHNYLGTTLADNILTPTFRNPIIVTQSVPDEPTKLQVGIYFGPFDSTGKLCKNIAPYKLYVGYYKIPATVCLATDDTKTDVDCDLPEHLYLEIVQRAVSAYKISKGGSEAPDK
jgi:hypothetical protein